MENAKITSYSKKELQDFYNVSSKTLKKWLNKVEDLGEYEGKRFTPAQVDKIFKHLGTT